MQSIIETLECRRLMTADLTGVFFGKVPTALPVQGTNHVTVRITNQGDGPANGTANVLLYSSTGASLDSSDTLLSTTKTRLDLKPTKGSNVPLKFASPTTLTTGAYYLIAEVVDGSTIIEQDTANNVFASPSTVTITAPFVDLTDTLTLSTKTTSYTVGAKKQTPLEFTLTVTNNGNIPAKGPLAISLFGSSNMTVDSQDPLLLSLAKKAIDINADGSRIYPVTFKPTVATPSGTFYGVAQISPGYPIVESNIDNDTAATSNQFTTTNSLLPAHPAFVGGLTDNVTVVFVGGPQSVTFSVDVADPTSTTAVEVDEVDASGNPISKIADLTDTNGGGIFSAVVPISFDTATTRYFVATLTDPSTDTSEHTVLLAIAGAGPITPG